MFALSRILVPTNLGEPSRTAIQYGVAFARQFEEGASIWRLEVETGRLEPLTAPDF